MSVRQFGPHGLRLLKQFEAEKNGEPAWEAYLCSAGKPTIGYGSRYWWDGREVKLGDRIHSEAEMDRLLQYSIDKFRRLIANYVTVPLAQHEFDALVSLAYNIGEGNFISSSVLRYLNAGDKQRAVGAFQMFTGVTTDRPTHRQQQTIDFAPIVGDGSWIGPQGQVARFMTRLRGLLRRRHAEACLFLGFDWVEACRDGAIKLRLEPIQKTIASGWSAKACRWEANAIEKTDLSEVLDVARTYPLPDLTIQGGNGEQDTTAATDPDEVDEDEIPPVYEIDSEIALPPLPPPAAPPPPVGTKLPDPETRPLDKIPYKIDPDAGAKPMEQSERFIGAMLTAVGVFLQTLMARGFAFAGSMGVAVTWFLEMMKTPATAAMVIAGACMIVTGIGWVIGLVLTRKGRAKKRQGELSATQAMY